MARRGRRVSLAEKLENSEKSLAGKSDPEIAKELERSVHTIRKWRRRFTQQGRSGLESKMGRPASGILGSYRKELREAITEMRKAGTPNDLDGAATRCVWGSTTVAQSFTDRNLAATSRFGTQV